MAAPWGLRIETFFPFEPTKLYVGILRGYDKREESYSMHVQCTCMYKRNLKPQSIEEMLKLRAGSSPADRNYSFSFLPPTRRFVEETHSALSTSV